MVRATTGEEVRWQNSRVRTIPSRTRPTLVVASVAAVAIYSWFVTDLRPFTLPIEIAVIVPALLVGVLAWVVVSRRTPKNGERPSMNLPTWRAAGPWVALLAILACLEVAEYFSSPRSDHPTLSSMADSLSSTHAGRATLFVAWLLLGFVLFIWRAAT
jgi:hypothetical protein